jgi:putative tryptophan/tyrosine transport system substrate-binding protein
MTGQDISAKRLELLKQAVPTVSRVAVLMDPNVKVHYVFFEAMAAAAKVLKITLRPIEVRGSDEIEPAFATMAQNRMRAAVVLSSGPLYIERGRIAKLALRHRLPTISSYRESAEAGGLMSYAPSLSSQIRRVANYVDKILKGAKPADLPVEQPTIFEFIINRQTAKALGLRIPHSILMRADLVD